MHLRRFISIHAPVKGATVINLICDSTSGHFNPRTREGCDSFLAGPLKRLRYFNPRTREGCDKDIATALGYAKPISIHAPVKGATPDDADRLLSLDISIHAPVKGATS